MKGNIEFLAGGFLPQRNVAIVLRRYRVIALGEAGAPGLKGEIDFERALGKARGVPATRARAIAATAKTIKRFM